MGSPILDFKEAIARAKAGDPEAVVSLQNVLRSIADGADRSDLVEISEAILAIRNEIARRQTERN